MQPLALFHLLDSPPALLRRLFEEVLILLKRPSPALRTVHPAPPAGEGVRDTKDEEEPVEEIVEHDGRDERDGEVGEAPDDDGDGGALCAAGGGVDLGGDEPGRNQPADAKDGCGEVEDDDAGDAGRKERDMERGFVCCEATKDGQNAKTDGAVPT